jgi:hypothetical protein
MVPMVCRYLLLALLVTFPGIGLAQAPAPAEKSGATDQQKVLQMAGKLIGQQHAWDESATNSATKLIFKEKSRKKIEQGTVITYDISAPDLPKDRHYTLMAWPLNREIAPVRGGITLDAGGRLLCTGKTPADCPAAKPGDDPYINIALQFAKGEAKRFALISDDQKSKALASVVAFPITGKDANCSLEALLGTPDADVVMIAGRGFPPSTGVPMSSDSAGEVSTGVWQVNAKGELASMVLPQVRGKTSGDSTIFLKSPACAPKISFHWGKGTYHVE